MGQIRERETMWRSGAANVRRRAASTVAQNPPSVIGRPVRELKNLNWYVLAPAGGIPKYNAGSPSIVECDEYYLDSQFLRKQRFQADGTTPAKLNVVNISDTDVKAGEYVLVQEIGGMPVVQSRGAKMSQEEFCEMLCNCDTLTKPQECDVPLCGNTPAQISVDIAGMVDCQAEGNTGDCDGLTIPYSWFNQTITAAPPADWDFSIPGKETWVDSGDIEGPVIDCGGGIGAFCQRDLRIRWSATIFCDGEQMGSSTGLTLQFSIAYGTPQWGPQINVPIATFGTPIPFTIPNSNCCHTNSQSGTATGSQGSGGGSRSTIFARFAARHRDVLSGCGTSDVAAVLGRWGRNPANVTALQIARLAKTIAARGKISADDAARAIEQFIEEGGLER